MIRVCGLALAILVLTVSGVRGATNDLSPTLPTQIYSFAIIPSLLDFESQSIQRPTFLP